MSTIYDTRNSPIKNALALIMAKGKRAVSSALDVVTIQLIFMLSARLDGLEDGTAVRAATTGNALATVGAGTYTGALLAGGTILRDPAGGNRTDTTDTAANLIAALGLDKDYKETTALIVNTADAAETITLAGGTGVTLKGAITVEQNTAVRLAILRTGPAAVTVRQV